MSNALIERAEQPLMGRRQYYNVAILPDEPCRGLDLSTIIVDVLQNIHVQNAIER
jgi:hypothetical protein